MHTFLLALLLHVHAGAECVRFPHHHMHHISPCPCPCPGDCDDTVPAAFLEYRSEDAITTAPAPTNVTVLESVNSGSYMAGQPWTFRVYATHVIGGTTYYNSAYVEVGPVVIVGNNVAIDFTWDICGR